MAPETHVLVVEDEPAIAESLAYALRKAGFTAELALDWGSAWKRRSHAGLILLDLMLPDGSGTDLILRLRAEGNSTPVIVLSSRDSEVDRVAALDGGADDYVTKPFSPREVLARVRAVLRRTDRISLGEARVVLRVDPSTRRAYFADAELDLTRVEFDLVAELVSAPGRVFGRSELIDRIWGEGFALTDRTIDSHVKALRKKVAAAGGSPDLIQTVRGVGYRMATHLSPDGEA